MARGDGYAVYLGLQILVIPFVVIIVAPYVVAAMLVGGFILLASKVLAHIIGR